MRQWLEVLWSIKVGYCGSRGTRQLVTHQEWFLVPHSCPLGGVVQSVEGTTGGGWQSAAAAGRLEIGSLDSLSKRVVLYQSYLSMGFCFFCGLYQKLMCCIPSDSVFIQQTFIPQPLITIDSDLVCALRKCHSLSGELDKGQGWG